MPILPEMQLFLFLYLTNFWRTKSKSIPYAKANFSGRRYAYLHELSCYRTYVAVNRTVLYERVSVFERRKSRAKQRRSQSCS